MYRRGKVKISWVGFNEVMIIHKRGSNAKAMKQARAIVLKKTPVI
jgi:hypothetical protein